MLKFVLGKVFSPFSLLSTCEKARNISNVPKIENAQIKIPKKEVCTSLKKKNPTKIATYTLPVINRFSIRLSLSNIAVAPISHGKIDERTLEITL